MDIIFVAVLDSGPWGRGFKINQSSQSIKYYVATLLFEISHTESSYKSTWILLEITSAFLVMRAEYPFAIYF